MFLTLKILLTASFNFFSWVLVLSWVASKVHYSHPWCYYAFGFGQTFWWHHTDCNGWGFLLFGQHNLMFSFHLLSHQFGVAIKGKCKVVVHDIWITLNVHPDWVVLQVDVANTFNSILCEAILQELHVVRGQLFLLFHFVHYFYAHQFFGHHSFRRKLFIILSFMGMR